MDVLINRIMFVVALCMSLPICILNACYGDDAVSLMLTMLIVQILCLIGFIFNTFVRKVEF